MIESQYGPPFDNPKWEDRKQEIENFLLVDDWIFNNSEQYVRTILNDLWVALEAEESDNRMLAGNLAEIYDEVSGGRISIPNTFPREVIGVFQERLNDYYEQGYADGREEGYDEGYEFGKDVGIAGEDI